MNAITFLLKEHEKVRKLLFDLSERSHRTETKIKLFEQLAEELVRHETMEQTIWYPFLKKNKIFADVIAHLLSEEKKAAKIIEKIQKNIEQGDEWEEEFLQLKADVEHHADEEEKHLFPQVKEMLDEETLEKIGKEMGEFKNNFENN